MSVVIGEVVYQNQMQMKNGQIAAALGPQAASQVTGGGAGASTQFIDQLPAARREVVRVAFADSLQPMWIMYTCFAAFGFIVMFGIKRKKLSREHEETKTGLEAEKANAAARKTEAEEKRVSKAEKRGSKHARPLSEATTAAATSDSEKDTSAAEAPDVPRTRTPTASNTAANSKL